MSKNFIIGIDLGATNIKVGLIKSRKIVHKQVLSTRDFASRGKLISGICVAINALLKAAHLSKNDVLGVGMGLPGPVDSVKGIVHYFPNIKGWRNVPLRRLMQQKTKLPVAIDNDANLMSLAEVRIGAARGLENVVGITLGTGVGGGIIINGRVYRGASFVAGEIGHIPLNEHGPKCNCGGNACLERYIGNSYILAEAQKAFGQGVTLETVTRLAEEGNSKAIAVWDKAAGHLGVGLSAVINILNPDAVVIGGGVASAGKFIFDKVRQVVRKRAMPTQARTAKIVKAKLGIDAGMLGAALLMEEESRKNDK